MHALLLLLLLDTVPGDIDIGGYVRTVASSSRSIGCATGCSVIIGAIQNHHQLYILIV